MSENLRPAPLANVVESLYYLNIARSQREVDNDKAIISYGNAIRCAQKEKNAHLLMSILLEGYCLTAKWAQTNAKYGNVLQAKDYYVIAAMWAQAAQRTQIAKQYYKNAALLCKMHVMTLDKSTTITDYTFNKMVDLCNEGFKYAEKSNDIHLAEDIGFIRKMMIMSKGISRIDLGKRD